MSVGLDSLKVSCGSGARYRCAYVHKQPFILITGPSPIPTLALHPSQNPGGVRSDKTGFRTLGNQGSYYLGFELLGLDDVCTNINYYDYMTTMTTAVAGETRLLYMRCCIYY